MDKTEQSSSFSRTSSGTKELVLSCVASFVLVSNFLPHVICAPLSLSPSLPLSPSSTCEGFWGEGIDRRGAHQKDFYPKNPCARSGRSFSTPPKQRRSLFNPNQFTEPYVLGVGPGFGYGNGMASLQVITSCRPSMGGVWQGPVRRERTDPDGSLKTKPISVSCLCI